MRGRRKTDLIPQRIEINKGAPFLMNNVFPQEGFLNRNISPWIYPAYGYPVYKRGHINTGPFFSSRKFPPMNSYGYLPHHFPPVASLFPQGEQQFYQGAKENKQNPVEAIFQNPLQPVDNSISSSGYDYPVNTNPYFYPYPKQTSVMKPSSGFHSLINSFKTQEGSFDIKKMVDTAGQMAYAVNQVQSLVKGLGGIIKV